MFSPDLIRSLALTLVVMLLSLSVHEFAHAWVADRLGDDTPRSQGRLTLSPLEHYDVFGTLVVPIAAVFFGQIPLIGWARPVEFSPFRLSRRFSMRTGLMLVAAAGPISNLLLATISQALLFMVTLVPALNSSSFYGSARIFLTTMVLTNLGLFVFNLLPVPPLDGSRLLPRRFDSALVKIAPFSFLILIVILWKFNGIVAVPVHWLQALMNLAIPAGGVA